MAAGTHELCSRLAPDKSGGAPETSFIFQIDFNCIFSDALICDFANLYFLCPDMTDAEIAAASPIDIFSVFFKIFEKIVPGQKLITEFVACDRKEEKKKAFETFRKIVEKANFFNDSSCPAADIPVSSQAEIIVGDVVNVTYMPYSLRHTAYYEGLEMTGIILSKISDGNAIVLTKKDDKYVIRTLFCPNTSYFGDSQDYDISITKVIL